MPEKKFGFRVAMDKVSDGSLDENPVSLGQRQNA
jgi:hypothetical protein